MSKSNDSNSSLFHSAEESVEVDTSLKSLVKQEVEDVLEGATEGKAGGRVTLRSVSGRRYNVLRFYLCRYEAFLGNSGAFEESESGISLDISEEAMRSLLLWIYREQVFVGTPGDLCELLELAHLKLMHDYLQRLQKAAVVSRCTAAIILPTADKLGMGQLKKRCIDQIVFDLRTEPDLDLTSLQENHVALLREILGTLARHPQLRFPEVKNDDCKTPNPRASFSFIRSPQPLAGVRPPNVPFQFKADRFD